MRQHLSLICAGFAAIAVPLCAETYQQQARIVGGGGNQGKCTVEVLVNGSAEVEIRGGHASLRSESGQQPEWRRFECTQIMPTNPANFHFRGADGRSGQRLVRDPRAGGAAVVRIDHLKGGPEDYTFDLIWSRPGAVSTSSVIADCRNAVRQRAEGNFLGRDIWVRFTEGDKPASNNLLYGAVDIRGPYGPDRTYPFSCSVNYGTGRVLSASISGPARSSGWWKGHDYRNGFSVKR